MKLKSNPHLWHRALHAWHSGAALRANRTRLLEHTYGRQWSDPIETPDGRIVSELENAKAAGMKPLTNNLLRSLVKSVVGRFRYNIAQPDASLKPDPRLDEFRSCNQLDELDARALEEFLISGCVIQKVIRENRPGTPFGVWADNVKPDRFFVNEFSDPRGTDIHLVGMFHSFTLPELKLRFGHGSMRRFSALERAFGHSSETCRVAEVWSFDINPSRPHNDPHWHCRFMMEGGVVIDETRSPLPSGSHPFAIKYYPLTDGRVHPFIEDLISQQKHINTLITTIDHILANSAKGVLLMPADALAPGVTIEDVGRLWSRPGGVIPISSSARQLPVEINSNAASQGASMLLDTEMKLFQQISGVTSALQGISTGSNTSASLYESQVYNSAIALLDVYETFNAFRKSRDMLALDCLCTESATDD